MQPQPLLSLLVAASANDVIGRDNALPWHLPEDLKHFKALTLGKPILMGRKTFESIGQPLPGRRSLVLTRSDWSRPGVTVVRSLQEALDLTRDAQELVVIGGAEVFSLAIPRAQRLYLTRVHARITGDTYLPPLGGGWREIERKEHPSDARHAYALTFSTLERERA